MLRNNKSLEEIRISKSHNNKLYNQWAGMIYRCKYPSSTNYEYYGGKGIRVCKEWVDDYYAFYKWAISNGYGENLEIDRINPEKDYMPENCRWLTHKDNSRNRGARKNSKSGKAGVSFRESRTGIGGSWRVGIMADGKQINIGTYDNLTEAIEARKEAELKYWGYIANGRG